jgi:hypothetical protein
MNDPNPHGVEKDILSEIYGRRPDAHKYANTFSNTVQIAIPDVIQNIL